MTDTTRDFVLKFGADTKEFEAGTRRVAKEINKLTKQQKADFAQNFKNRKAVNQIAGPQQQRQLTAELKKQNQEHRTTNRLLKEELSLWQRISSAAKSAWKATAGSGMDAARARREQRRGTGFWAGFGAGMGPGPSFSRYGLGHGLASATRAGIGLAGGGLRALFTAPVNAVYSDYQAYFSYARNMANLSGLNRGASFGAGLTFAGVDKSAKGRLTELGYSPEESISGYRAFARATGSGKYTETGMALAKTLGLEVSDVSGFMNTMRAGKGTFGAESMREMQRMLAAAVKSGVNASTLPEYFEGIKGFISGVGAVSGGVVSGLPMAQLLNFFEKSGFAGLKGARGVEVVSKLDAAIKSPGGGEEGKAFILNTLGFGTSSGGISYYQAKKQMELGLGGAGGAALAKQLLDNADRVSGSQEEANMYLDEITGITLDQWETIRAAFEKGDMSLVEKTLSDATATELDRLTSIDSQMREFLRAARRSTELQWEDIDRGEKMKEVVESLQNTFNKFLTDMIPLTKLIGEVLAKNLPTITEAVSGIAEVIVGVKKFNVVMSEESREWRKVARTEHRKMRELLPRLEAGGADLTDEELSTVISSAITARHAYRAAYDNPSFLDAVDELVAQSIGEESPADRAARERVENFNRAVRALDMLAERMGRGDEVDPARITNDQQLIAAMTAIGLAIPPSVRASIDSTGGSP